MSMIDCRDYDDYLDNMICWETIGLEDILEPLVLVLVRFVPETRSRARLR